jgi:hypothetical protein
MLQLSMYSDRTAKLNSMTPRMNQGALLPDGSFGNTAA